jgi:hypothetical protein
MSLACSFYVCVIILDMEAGLRNKSIDNCANGFYFLCLTRLFPVGARCVFIPTSSLKKVMMVDQSLINRSRAIRGDKGI